jgi:hypothetical protein
MAGAGTISVNQSPQYGEKTAIDSAAKAVTTTPMTGNATPAPSAGRPSTGNNGSIQIPAQGIPMAHSELAADLARKAWAAQGWAELAAQPQAGPRVRMYAQAAQKAYEEATIAAQNSTPNFE